MTTNHNESGLFDNPYLDEQLDQDKQTTLEQIKDDTSAIRET